MSVRGWGERELPEGLKWLPVTPWGGHYLVSTEHDHEQDRRYRASGTTAEMVLRVFAPDEIVEPPEQCSSPLCELQNDHDGWPHLYASEDGVRTAVHQALLFVRLERHALANAPWSDGASDV